MLQGRAFKELHHDVGAAILFADVVDRANVGMVERRGRLRFSLETAQRLGIAGDVIGKKLQCDETVKASVLGLVDNAHAASAQLFDDAVVGDGLADHWKRKIRRDAILWAGTG
jgi:hypothetical protein